MQSLKKTSVTAEAISLSYGSTPVLNNLSLSVEPGEFFALLGPSGSGKSSLLRILAGFVTPDKGRVLIEGVDVTQAPAHKRNVGMVFQNYALWPHLSVWDNVAFGLVERRVAKKLLIERVQNVLSMVGLDGYGDRRPATLSGGQQQRVALARTLVIEPQVLLLDEPFSNLDKQLRVQVRQELRAIQRELGITTIFVTHDQEEAMTTADRVAVLEAGILQQIGTPGGLFDFPINKFVAGFVGTANLLRGRVTAVSGEMVQFEALGLGVLSISRSANFRVRLGEAVLAFRPHQVVVKVGDEQVDASRIWVNGLVQSSEFMGEFSRYRVQVGDLLLFADQPHYAGLFMFPVGASVRLGIEPGQVRFLTA